MVGVPNENGSSPIQSNPHVSVIQSTVPKEDADAMLRLVPGLFQLESETSSSVVLVSKRMSSVSLIFVQNSDTTHQPPTVPLIVSQEQIQTARRVCNDLESVSVEFTRDVAANNRMGDCTICKIRLPGSSVLLTPPSLAGTPKGRVLLTMALTKPPDEFDSYVQEEIETTGSGDSELVEIQVEQESNNGSAIMEEQDYPIAKFPTLAVNVLEKNGDITTGFPINSQEAVPIETDLFKGRMLMLLKPLRPQDDPYWDERLFSKKKRRFVFQLQGKFKRVPQGTLYAGGEISNQMKLGLVAKGICGLLLKLVKSVAPDTHYSFGDNNDKEKPHIVVPAWSFFERLVVTKPGQEPPELGDEFVESKDSMDARKSGKSKAEWNTEDTYSMSFYTMYLDFAKWQVVQVPVTSDIDLKTFWGNSFLRIVLFENTTPVKDGRHLQKDNTYYFAIELRHLSLMPRDDRGEEEEETTPLWDKHPRSGSFRLLKDMERQDSGALLAEAYDEDLFFDAEEENSLHEIGEESFHPSLSSRSRPSVSILSTIDSVCPAMVEICHKGRYIKTYAFNLKKKRSTIFRTADSVEENFATSSAEQAAEEMWSPRISSSERCRRVLGQTISRALADDTATGVVRLGKFADLRPSFATDFLRRAQPSWTHKQKNNVRQSGYGARALSDRHWMEEWIQITDHYISFHHPERHKPHFRINLQSIVDVECLPSADAPDMSTYSFIAIGTLGRTVYIMFPSEIQGQDWVDLITGLIAMRNASNVQSSPDSKSVSSDHSILFDDPADEFLQDSSLWNCKQRRILNGRKFSFHSRESPMPDAANVVSDALVRAIDQASDYNETGMLAFLDRVAELKDVDVYCLDETARLSFFLNLYHTMIMHAFIVLGPPDSSFKWISYFNAIAYQCSDDILSLTELEHCIIRAAMNYPSQFVSKFVIPKSKFAFALSRSDYRINFALNCGSLSNPDIVPIYEAHRLDEQLEEASRCYMHYAAEARKSTRRAGGVTLTLPKICQWFSDDFGNGSTNDIVRCVERFLYDDQRKLVASCFWKDEDRFNMNDLNVKFGSYSFDCRNLKLASE